MPANEHVLSTLKLPTRYEPLSELLGSDVLKILVEPAAETLGLFEDAADAVMSMHEGILVPIYARPGTGKTTLSENLNTFLPSQFTKTLSYKGPLELEKLESALEIFKREEIPANEHRVIPINVDHREGTPPNTDELGALKNFLREGKGTRSIICWPSTLPNIAEEIADSYKFISGVTPLDLPLRIEGPAPDRWQHLASQTLQLANQIDSLEYILDLDAFKADKFETIGDYLRHISIDFNRAKRRLERATVKPVRLTILIASESTGSSILSNLTSSQRFGMLDPNALLQASGQSRIGLWWKARRGLLISTIIKLDAHTLCFPPSVLVSILRRYGTEETGNALTEMGITSRTPAEVSSYLRRSDLGRHIIAEQRSVGETRGNPADEARAAFQLLAESKSFHGGRDKQLNKSVATAIEAFMVSDVTSDAKVTPEKAVPFASALIPDIAALTPEDAHCIEITYRKGDFLTSENRGNIAQYCLEKLKNYTIGLGWASLDS